MRFRRFAPLLAVAPIALFMCASATEIDVDIYSEVDCTKSAEVGLVLGGQLTDLGTNAVSSTSTACNTSQRVGRVVLTPSGAHDEEIAFQVVTRNDGQGVETCTGATGYEGCIVARRQLHFTPRTALDVRVDLRLSCLDHPCDPTSTCVRGACVTGVCPAEGCADEQTLVARPSCVPPAAASAPVTIVASTGSVAIPTGLAQQTHLVLAENDCRYWYFYLDDQSASIKTRVSSDLATWSDGDAIPLSGSLGGKAGNFSVAYVNTGSTDVIHILADQPASQNGQQTGFPYHYRLTLEGPRGSAKPTAPVSAFVIEDDAGGVQGGDCFDLVDGPSIAVASDGHVFAATGWVYEENPVRTGNHCDMDVFRSVGRETGNAAEWVAQFTPSGYFVTDENTSDHLLLTLPEAGTVVGAFPEPQSGGPPFYSSVAWLMDVSDWDGGRPASGYDYHYPTGSIFDRSSDTSDNYTNDWAVCVISDGEIHALRHQRLGPFEGEDWNGSTWSASLQSPPALALGAKGTTPPGNGVVVMNDGDPSHGMVAFVVDPDGTTIKLARYTAATRTWSTTWTAVPGIAAGPARQWLAGTGCGHTHPTLLWTETASTAIVALDVSSLVASP